jgi:hypothetical protein
MWIETRKRETNNSLTLGKLLITKTNNTGTETLFLNNVACPQVVHGGDGLQCWR